MAKEYNLILKLILSSIDKINSAKRWKGINPNKEGSYVSIPSYNEINL